MDVKLGLILSNKNRERLKIEYGDRYAVLAMTTGRKSFLWELQKVIGIAG